MNHYVHDVNFTAVSIEKQNENFFIIQNIL
jgi:hypothetical protein